MDNVLNSGDSPNGLVNVRRLNHVPIYIISVLATVIVLMIAMVAIDKSRKQAQRTEDHGGSSDSYAAQAVGDHVGYLPAFHSPTPWPRPTPPLVSSATPGPTPDESELKARRSAFYAALGAPSVVVDEPASAPSTVQQVQAPPTLPIMPYESAPNAIATPRDPNALSSYLGDKDRWKLGNRVEKPAGTYILQTGWVIPALLISGMESELPGTVIAQTSQDVYDSPSGRYLLIPQGSRLVGEYANSIAYGQARIFVAWQRIIFPNGNTLDIGAMPGTDGQGEAGFHDQVDNHFIRIFGSALLMSAITGGISLSQPAQSASAAPNSGSTLSSALGQQLGAATSALLERNLSIPPTLKIRQGYRFNIVAVKDLVFDKPYVVPNYDKHS